LTIDGHTDALYARTRVTSGLLALCGIALLASLEVDVAAQLGLCAVTIALLVVLAWLQPRDGLLRIFATLLIVFTSTRYMIWRASGTVPLEDPVAAVFALGLFGAEAYSYIVLLLSIFVVTDLRERPRRSLPLLAERCPTVDILIPSYSEDPDLLEVTLRAALNVSYPKDKLTVYLLDDGGTFHRRRLPDPVKAAEARHRHELLQRLCEKVGAVYMTRLDNDHAKAGNINAALPRTSGELVLILDADHVPTRDILNRTVPYFIDDPRVFLVQTPHFFLNADPLERNLDTFQQMPSENEMFYAVIQRGLDGLDGSFFCGSAAVLRREALEEIGGISGDTITEDAETALELHARGWRSVYVDQPMIAGLSSETFSGFIAQRMRWCQGMVQIFLLKNPLLRPGLSLGQRLCYLNSCFFWFFPYARLAFLLSPLAFLLLGLEVYDATADEFFAYALPHVVGAVLLSVMFFGRTRWLFVSELYELLQSVHCALAITKVLRSPRSPEFVVTPKGEQLRSDFRAPLAQPFYWLLALVLAGEVVGIGRWLLVPEDRDMSVVLLFWNSFHLLLLVAALGVLFEQAQRRRYPRLPRDAPVRLETAGTSLSARTTDVSATGVGIVLGPGEEPALSPGAEVMLDARQYGSRAVGRMPMTVRSLRHLPGGHTEIGLEYRLDSAEQWQAAITFSYARSVTWTQFRQQRARSRSESFKLGFLLHRSFVHAYEHMRSFIRGTA
jgi:cellulose synthase (UDP-forming)